ncbi:N-acetyltransferase, partial [Streptomyces sp. SID625]|nr:N-acetyltransferase [Streptomyces sp. SID625]
MPSADTGTAPSPAPDRAPAAAPAEASGDGEDTLDLRLPE